MKAAMLFTGSGPIVILTSYPSIREPDLLHRLREKGIAKFLAYEIPHPMAEERYGHQYTQVMQNSYETNHLRILDINGHRVFSMFNMAELGEPALHETVA